MKHIKQPTLFADLNNKKLIIKKVNVLDHCLLKKTIHN